MNTPLETLLHDLSHETLSEEERARMRTLLTEYAAFRPIRATARAPQSAFLGAIAMWAHPRPAFALAMAFIVLAGGAGGTAYAAEGTLPGDLLYPIKVGVTEPTVSALTASGKAQASWQMQLAERRITEAATLAKQGRLSTGTETALATRFTQAAEAAAVDVAGEHNADLQSTASTNFTTRLAAYDQVFARARQDSPASTTSSIRSAIHLAINSWERERDDNTQEVTTSVPDKNEGVGPRPAVLQSAARAAVKHAADAVGLAQAAFDAPTSESAADALSAASMLIEQGQAQLAAHDEAGAAKSFRASIDAATRIDVFTQAATTLQINAFEDAPSSKEGEESSTTTDVSSGNGGAAVIESVIRLEQDQKSLRGND